MERKKRGLSPNYSAALPAGNMICVCVTMATVCPMCQMNLDAYQGEANRFFGTKYHMPIVFFTQLMALAFGIEPKHAGFGLELVSAKDALARIGVEVPQAVDATKPKKPEGLPMPPRRHKKFASGQEASE